MTARIDVICMSHLRWSATMQRPHQLMRRLAADHRVFFVEEPIYDDCTVRMDVSDAGNGVFVATPYLPVGLSDKKEFASLKRLMDVLVVDHDIREHVLWMTTPNAVPHTRHLRPLVTVHDASCDLYGYRGHLEVLRERETEMLRRCNLVFADGEPTAAAKRRFNSHVHVVPSPVDIAAFQSGGPEPAELAAIPRPRIGVVCPLDERLDTELLGAIAEARPDWQYVLIGPTTRASVGRIPRRPNVHLVGPRPLEEMPAVLAALDVVTMPLSPTPPGRPLAAARFIECLAAGKPIVATLVPPEVQSLVGAELLQQASDGSTLLVHVEAALQGQAPRHAERRESLLRGPDWDAVFARIRPLVADAVANSLRVAIPPYVPVITSPAPPTMMAG